ncbi:2-amino-4-oxopentanoate thiolase subunit OrtB [uncultured Roseovarius sp.]|uniref:2-amino-4-oxopentanoate thiolase subunit OrtB n=1 Tax=uncultured Roseovarius sp. TaxID=293344 RepID=UPI002638E7CD|nr:2-amino-4-oxopentanoate thiolase subunit OrtB [uncultured Roseovarius sp.]
MIEKGKFNSVMARKNEIMKASIGIDFGEFESGGISFDYEKMMRKTGYTLAEMKVIQRHAGVGNTPLLELRNLTSLARMVTNKPGKGARIFVKDEASNPSGSFKDRRAANAVYHAKRLGYAGVVAATSGNYGAAVASQAAINGLKCIIVQECYDRDGIGQPEIIEKARRCEAYGAEVLQLSVGPELFLTFLNVLEETGYFNASLYSPFGIAGVETLGVEIAQQMQELTGNFPDMVVCTHAGGGNLTGTARGLRKAGAVDTQVVGASVNLKGLHMASDHQFNRKSFTTGHTGFGIPFATKPDRSDVPRSAARVLRYMDRYVTVNQGEVFYATEALSRLEGLERGPAGNTSLAAAFSLAQEMGKDQTLVVQETEYTGAGKHVQAQLTFAKSRGIDVLFGNPQEETVGSSIVLPNHPRQIRAVDINLNRLRQSYIRNALVGRNDVELSEVDISFLVNETQSSEQFVRNTIADLAAAQHS